MNTKTTPSRTPWLAASRASAMLAALALAAGTASAATISVESTEVFGENETDGAVTIDLTDFTPVANDLLIVAFAQEHSDGDGGGITGVQYGGVNMSLAAQADREDTSSTNTALSSIWYIDPADGTSDLTFNAGTDNIRFITSVMHVSGTSGSVEASDTTVQDSVPIEAGPISVSAGSLVIDSYAFPRGGDDTIDTQGLVDVSSGGTLLQEYDTDTVGGGSAFSQFGASYLIPGSDQPSLSTTWDHDGQTGDKSGHASLAMVSFAAIPEPTSALLLLTGVGVLAWRRRGRDELRA